MFAMILGYTVPDWALFIAPVLGTVMYAWGGWPFLTGAVSELRSRKPGMMLLIGLALTFAVLLVFSLLFRRKIHWMLCNVSFSAIWRALFVAPLFLTGLFIWMRQIPVDLIGRDVVETECILTTRIQSIPIATSRF